MVSCVYETNYKFLHSLALLAFKNLSIILILCLLLYMHTHTHILKPYMHFHKHICTPRNTKLPHPCIPTHTYTNSHSPHPDIWIPPTFCPDIIKNIAFLMELPLRQASASGLHRTKLNSFK